MRWLLIAFMVLSSIPAYALDSYTDDMTTTTGWTDGDTGTTSEWTQTTFDGRSCFKFTVGTGADARLSYAYKTAPVSGSVYIFSFTSYFETIGTKANNAYFYVPFFYGGDGYVTLIFASDGLYMTGTDGTGYTEVGTDVVDQDVWTDWKFVVKAPTTATATADVYKNGVLIASGVDCSRTGGTTPGRIGFSQYGYVGNGNTSYVDSISVTSYGLQYLENCDSITDWTDGDVGNGVSTQETFDSKSTFKMYVPTASGTSLANRNILTGLALPMNYIVETSVYHSSIGTRAATNHLYILIRRTSGYINIFYFASDGFFLYVDGTGYVEQGTNIVSQSVWENWRFFIKNATDNSAKVWGWKNGVLQFSNATMKTSSSGTAGQIAVGQYGYTLSGTLSYIDYLRIYSEDGQLIQSVIE